MGCSASAPRRVTKAQATLPELTALVSWTGFARNAMQTITVTRAGEVQPLMSLTAASAHVRHGGSVRKIPRLDFGVQNGGSSLYFSARADNGRCDGQWAIYLGKAASGPALWVRSHTETDGKTADGGVTWTREGESSALPDQLSLVRRGRLVLIFRGAPPERTGSGEVCADDLLASLSLQFSRPNGKDGSKAFKLSFAKNLLSSAASRGELCVFAAIATDCFWAPNHPVAYGKRRVRETYVSSVEDSRNSL